jgi:hypothetical protein
MSLDGFIADPNDSLDVPLERFSEPSALADEAIGTTGAFMAGGHSFAATSARSTGERPVALGFVGRTLYLVGTIGSGLVDEIRVNVLTAVLGEDLELYILAWGGEVDLRDQDHDRATDRYDIAVTGGANNVSIDRR